MSTNIYTAGLQNVGSYRVSGQPFVVRKSINAGEEVKIEFPYVAKNVIVKIPNPPNNAIRTVAGQGRFMTSDPGPQPGVYDLGGSGKDFTLSFWYRELDTWSNNKRVFTLTDGGASISNFRAKASAGRYHFTEADNAVTALGPNGVGNWFRVTLTQKTGSTFCYFDDVVVQDTSSLHPNFDDFQFPGNSVPLGGGIDEVMVFSSGMNDTQVRELHNSGEYFKPTRHSLSANLLSWHTADDPTDGVDTNEDIKDLAGTDEPARLHSTGDNSFTTGPWATQTTGKVRVHSLSLTSSSGANIVANSHFKELQGYGQSFSMPMKSKEIYISSVDAQVTVEIIAELTNIPTERMYALTGPGIDE